MSLLYTVVFANCCRTTQQLLAVDALRHLRSREARRWRGLFLRERHEYLSGVAAPDAVFKDYKNHVLHVRAKDWGGAIEACQEWHRRTVRALRRNDWKQAAWSAGVLCHYYTDLLQPLHTHQTEEGDVIHSAFARSVFKSYTALQALLERELGGFPNIEVPRGDKWLAQMARDGAKAANAHYEFVVDHYDFDAGVREPRAGLDPALQEVMAELMGHAAVGFARILDRAFEYAAVRPPRANGAFDALLLALAGPFHNARKKRDDARARLEAEGQHEEYWRTGKLRATLSEHDRVVRTLYAAEVLKTPLSSLDAKWPREIGAMAGQPRDDAAPAPEEEQEAPALEIAPVETQAPAKRRRAPKLPRELPAGAPLAKREKVLPRFTLSGAAPVVQAPSIGPRTARRLEAAGVKTVADLLALRPEQGECRIDARDMSAETIRDWQAQALLACTVPGLRSYEAQALVACGVRNAEELVELDPADLTDAIARWGLTEEGQRAWGAAPAPSEDDVATWIERARRVLQTGESALAA